MGCEYINRILAWDILSLTVRSMYVNSIYQVEQAIKESSSTPQEKNTALEILESLQKLWERTA
jgi:hypothetical protein